MKKLLLVFATVATFTTSSMAIEVLAGGSIPVINSVIGIGTMTLDFSSPGTLMRIAYLIINNNTQQFDLALDATNNGNFICDALIADGLPAGSVTVPMSALEWADFSQGTLGTTQAANVIVATDPAILGGIATGDIKAAVNAGTVTWTYLQQSSTENYGLGVNASWAAADLLAGLYAETFTISITPTM